MGYRRQKGDGAALAVLVIGGALAAGAFAMAMRIEALQRAAVFDSFNALFVVMVTLAFGAIGNGLAILLTSHVFLPKIWWMLGIALGGTLYGLALGFGWTLPLALAAFGGALWLTFEVLGLLGLPFEIAATLLEANKGVRAWSSRRIKRRS